MKISEYSGMPQRLRRIVKAYEYCVETVEPLPSQGYKILLKDKFKHRDGGQHMFVGDPNELEDLIYFFKNIVLNGNPPLKVALYGFGCRCCGEYVSKGMNYVEVQGLPVCVHCGLNP